MTRFNLLPCSPIAILCLCATSLATDTSIDLRYQGQPLIQRPVQVQLIEARDGTTIVGQLIEDAALVRRFTSDKHEISWSDERRMSGGALEWRFTLNNHTNERRGINLVVTLTLEGADWVALFTGQNDRPEWPDEGTLRYVYIRSQETSDNNLKAWNAWAMLTIPFGSLYHEGKDIGLSVVGQDLAFPYYTVYFEATRQKESVEFKLTHPRIRLEPGGERTVSFYLIPHAGDWRPGMEWMRRRWKDSFDVSEAVWQMQSVSYDGLAALGPRREREALGNSYWNDKLRFYPWRDRGMIQSRGLDRWYGMWVPEKEPWKSNVGHKYRQMIERPEDFPKEIIETKPETTAPWREQLDYVDNLEFIFSPKSRQQAATISSLYPMWESFTHAEVHQLLDKIHSLDWHTISHFDLGAAWSPWLRQKFPESAYPGTFYYQAPIWSMPDPFPGSRWRTHIINQIRQLFDTWPGYDGIMLDQMYYEGERAAAEDGTTVDDGITVANDGSVASNLMRTNGQTLAEIRKIMAKRGKVIWGNHARTPFCMSANCDLLISENVPFPGMAEDPGKYLTIGNKGLHVLQSGERGWQMCAMAGRTASMVHFRAKPLLATPRDTDEFMMYPYYSLFSLFPGCRWELAPRALTLPVGKRGNIFRRHDGNVLATVVSYAVSTKSPWWESDVPVKMRLPDAGDMRGAYVLSADYLGPKKVPFERNGDEIIVRLPLHRSVSMVVLAKTGKVVSLNSACFASRVGRNNGMQLFLDNWTEEAWNWSGQILRKPADPDDRFTLFNARQLPEEGGGLAFNGKDAYAEAPALAFGRDDKKTISLYFRTKTGGAFLDMSFAKDGGNFFELIPYLNRQKGTLGTWGKSQVAGRKTKLFIASEPDLRDGKWHQWTFVWDGSEKPRTAVYIDGELLRTEETDLSELPWTAAQTKGNSVGRARHFWHLYNLRHQEFFEGAIDDLMIFNRVLSAEQARAIYEQGRNTPPESQASRPWRMWTFDNVQDGQAQAWAAWRRTSRVTPLAATVAPMSSQTTAFELLPDDSNIDQGFARFTLVQDDNVLLPRPDALPGNQYTFETIAGGPFGGSGGMSGGAVSIAPPQALVKRTDCNTNTYRGTGVYSILQAHPLSLYKGETQTFQVTVMNNGEAARQVGVSADGQGVTVSGAPKTLNVPGRSRAAFPLSVRGSAAGGGRITVTVTTENRLRGTGNLDIRVVGRFLESDQLKKVRAVRMIFDSWYSPGVPGASISLNGVDVGKLPRNGGYSSWTMNQPEDLDEKAAASLAPRNALVIKTAGRNFKMRNVALECTLDDERVVILAAEEKRPQSVPADWPAAEGIRLRDGQDMIWHIPATF